MPNSSDLHKSCTRNFTRLTQFNQSSITILACCHKNRVQRDPANNFLVESVFQVCQVFLSLIWHFNWNRIFSVLPCCCCPMLKKYRDRLPFSCTQSRTISRMPKIGREWSWRGIHDDHRWTNLYQFFSLAQQFLMAMWAIHLAVIISNYLLKIWHFGFDIFAGMIILIRQHRLSLFNFGLQFIVLLRRDLVFVFVHFGFRIVDDTFGLVHLRRKTKLD